MTALGTMDVAYESMLTTYPRQVKRAHRPVPPGDSSSDKSPKIVYIRSYLGKYVLEAVGKTSKPSAGGRRRRGNKEALEGGRVQLVIEDGGVVWC